MDMDLLINSIIFDLEWLKWCLDNNLTHCIKIGPDFTKSVSHHSCLYNSTGGFDKNLNFGNIFYSARSSEVLQEISKFKDVLENIYNLMESGQEVKIGFTLSEIRDRKIDDILS